LERNLKDALDRYDKAKSARAVADRNELAARNNLNAAQKQLDTYVRKLRDAAPSGSDWGMERAHKFAVREAK
jgi:hypothetical protein